MKKMMQVAILSALGVTTSAQAGTMGDAYVKPHHMLFTSLDAAYTWPSSSPNFRVNGVDTGNPLFAPNSSSKNGWGGRFAVGARHYTATPLSYTAEAGWGWYGYYQYTNNQIPVVQDATLQSSFGLFGVDLLFGVMYEFNRVDVFAKVGALFQDTLWIHQITSASNKSKITSSNVSTLPELSVGGVYNITDRLGIDLAYYYAFGSHLSYADNLEANAGNGGINIRDVPTGISILSFGLRYAFA